MKIISGKKKKPFAIIVAGEPGTGKSTFASHAPKPIFIPTEDTSELDIDRYPVAKTWPSFLSALDDVKNFDYKTVVIDAIDGVETLLHKWLLENDPKRSKTAASAYGGYGNFYVEAQKHFDQDLKSRLESLRDDHGKHIIIVAHTTKKSVIDPVIGASYDSLTLNLHPKTHSVLVDWVSCVMFASKVSVMAETNGKGSFAVGTGERVLYTEGRPGFTSAKNRYNLPFEMPLDFHVFYKGYEDFFSGKKRQIEDILASLNLLTAQITDEEMAKKVGEAILKAGGDIDKLEAIETKLKSRFET